MRIECCKNCSAFIHFLSELSHFILALFFISTYTHERYYTIPVARVYLTCLQAETLETEHCMKCIVCMQTGHKNTNTHTKGKQLKKSKTERIYIR